MKQTPIHVQGILDIRHISVKHKIVIVTLDFGQSVSNLDN